MFNKIQSVNQNLKENVRTNEKQILEKMGLKFHKLESDMYFVVKSVSLLFQVVTMEQVIASESDWVFQFLKKPKLEYSKYNHQSIFVNIII